MKKIRICIIGAGNISNTRHIPAIYKNSDMEIVGIVSDDSKKVERTLKKHKKLNGVSTLIIMPNEDVRLQLEECKWFVENVDAVVIGTPPMQHYSMTKACLELDKHVMVEKPMMMEKDECSEVEELAKRKGLILMVMHSFQFSKGMIKLNNDSAW